ncbi:hypothetical protein B7494_g3260 [Chlorociboria aeruginascens]|nr:hypothetical protein B7494_g3260 [Chlorociboria aeruginascens]
MMNHTDSPADIKSSAERIEGPIEEFTSLLSSSDFLFVVFYRGTWCPFCISYLKTLSTMQSKINGANGTTLAVTSQPSSFLPALRSSTNYSGPTINDPSNTLVKDLEKRGLIKLVISEKKGYEHGMVQPGVLVLTKSGEVLEKWTQIPSVKNLGGAKDRPDLNQIWENVESKMKGGQVVHKTYSLQGILGVIREKLFG